MKRLTASFIILAVVLGLWLLEGFAVTKITRDMTDKIDLVEYALKSKEFDKAAEYAEQFYDDWDHGSEWVSMFVTREIIDDITVNAARLRTFSPSDGSDDAIASAMEIKDLLKEIRQRREVNLVNVF